MDFFIGDTHFGHKNVIRFCKRPFKTVAHMNESISLKWNELITDADRVFVLGDVFLMDASEAENIIKNLNGYKILIAGNHDRSEKTMLSVGFDEYHRRYDYNIDGIGTGLLLHYPMPDCIIDNLGYKFLIHGHIHRPPRSHGLKVNVACDLINFTPISVNEVKEIILSSSTSHEDEEFFAEVDSGILKVDMKIRMQDFSGAIDHIYTIMRDHWSEVKK